jgi:hypothetical protein
MGMPVSPEEFERLKRAAREPDEPAEANCEDDESADATCEEEPPKP